MPTSEAQLGNLKMRLKQNLTGEEAAYHKSEQIRANLLHLLLDNVNQYFSRMKINELLET